MRLIRQDDIDLVEGSSVNLQAAVAARVTRTPCIWRLADISAPGVIRRAVGAAIPRLADEILVNGRATLAAYPGLERSGARVTNYYPMADEAVFATDSAVRPARAAKLVGTVANLNPDKGIELFVEVAGLLRDRTEVTFTVVGAVHETHRRYYERIHEQVAKLQLTGRIAFVGEQRDVAAWMRRFDVFVITSRREGTTTTAIEAMASALPVVATDVGSVREVVRDGVTGYLTPPNDAHALARRVGELLDDDVKRERMGSRGRQEYVERFALAPLIAARMASYHRVARRRAVRTDRSGKGALDERDRATPVR